MKFKKGDIVICIRDIHEHKIGKIDKIRDALTGDNRYRLENGGVFWEKHNSFINAEFTKSPLWKLMNE
jgi:hypothetical protein